VTDDPTAADPTANDPTANDPTANDPTANDPADPDEAAADVLYSEVGEIAYITLNRPAKLNALSPDVFRLIDQHRATFSASEQARVAILHGAGRAFAAGADIEHYVGLTVGEYADFMRLGNGVQQRLAECGKPVIAAVHGYALGGGLELALCCDLIIAEPDAQLGLPESKLGLLPGGGGTQRLPRLIGAVRTAELLMTGRSMSGAEAVSLGLALPLGEEPTALAAAERLAGRICRTAPIAARMAKQLLQISRDTPMPACLSAEQAVGAMLYATQDAQEGIAAFVEKRRAVFGGR
jgi:enoyl-CoA hydratase